MWKLDLTQLELTCSNPSMETKEKYEKVIQS